MVMSIIIKPDNTTEVRDIPAGVEGYDTMIELVGCKPGYLEMKFLSPTLNVWMDEEGKMKSRPLNSVCTRIARTNGAISADDFIVGTVVVSGPIGNDGNERSVSDSDVKFIHNLAKRIIDEA